ncbi:MAG: NUDIX domain-containing protein [Pseudomonadota bacterium]
MLTTVPEDRLNVAVGVVWRDDGSMLVQQRTPGRPCAGKWEFPGGKIEHNETPLDALSRELMEELGICVEDATPLTNIAFDYTHANVWLQVFEVHTFTGEVKGCEGQEISWRTVSTIRELDLLEAVEPILQALQKS